MEFYDISPLISPRIAVFPGDQPFQLIPTITPCAEHAIKVSQISATLHLGAHVDAVCHTQPGGEDIATLDCARLLGPCQVIHCAAVTTPPYRLQIEAFANKIITQPRVLIATNSFPDPNQWRDDFTALSPECIAMLANHGVDVVGIDTPSVDPSDSKALESHAALRHHGMLNLEGLVLAHVPEGNYTLVALPLKIQGADASPVRAVLVSPHFFNYNEWI